MKVLVCGGRNFSDTELLNRALDKFHRLHTITCVISGMANGADTYGLDWAIRNNVSTEKYPALWNLHGKRAGFVRNQQMLDEGNPDVVIAFAGGRGTEMMCEIAEKAGVRVYRV